MSTVNYEGHLATVVNFTNIFCQFSIDKHVQISKPNCKRIKVAQNTSILKAGHKKLMKLTAVHPNSIAQFNSIQKNFRSVVWFLRRKLLFVGRPDLTRNAQTGLFRNGCFQKNYFPFTQLDWGNTIMDHSNVRNYVCTWYTPDNCARSYRL